MNSLVIYPAFLDFEEIVIILVVAVVLFGPDKIPEIARGLGSAVRKLKEASEEIKQEIMNPVEDINPVKDIQESVKNLNLMDDVKNSFKKIDPMDDFQKSFDEVGNPINEIDEIIKQQKHQELSINQAVEITTSLEKESINNLGELEEEQPEIALNENNKEDKKKYDSTTDVPLGGSVSR